MHYFVNLLAILNGDVSLLWPSSSISHCCCVVYPCLINVSVCYQTNLRFTSRKKLHIDYLIPGYDIIVLDWHFNLQREKNRRWHISLAGFNTICWRFCSGSLFGGTLCVCSWVEFGIHICYCRIPNRSTSSRQYYNQRATTLSLQCFVASGQSQQWTTSSCGAHQWAYKVSK